MACLLLLTTNVFSFSLYRGNPIVFAQSQSGADIQVATSPLIEKQSTLHDQDKLKVQWQAFNAGTNTSQGFNDELVVTKIDEGCPGDSTKDHPVVYDSAQDNNTNPQDFAESPIAPQHVGDLKSTTVGPFPAGWYQFTITLGKGVYNIVQDGDCREITQSSSNDNSSATSSSNDNSSATGQ